MHLLIMSLVLFGALLIGNISCKGQSGIPTKEEQANVLSNVEEVFTQVKNLVLYEGTLTDQSAIEDLGRLIKREQDKLCLVEELALLKLTCFTSRNSVCTSDAKPRVQRIIQDGHLALDQCIKQAITNVTLSSTAVYNVTEKATARSQSFIDTLSVCSNKSGLQQISCYRRIMLQDVVPVKLMLLEAINTHRDSHQRVISVRAIASDCVEDVMKVYQADVAQVLADSLKCK